MRFIRIFYESKFCTLAWITLDNAFSQQEEEEEKDNFGSSRLSEESYFQHLICGRRGRVSFLLELTN